MMRRVRSVRGSALTLACAALLYKEAQLVGAGMISATSQAAEQNANECM